MINLLLVGNSLQLLAFFTCRCFSPKKMIDVTSVIVVDIVVVDIVVVVVVVVRVRFTSSHVDSFLSILQYL